MPETQSFAGVFLQSPRREEEQKEITFIPNSSKSHVNNTEVDALTGQEKQDFFFPFLFKHTAPLSLPHPMLPQ